MCSTNVACSSHLNHIIYFIKRAAVIDVTILFRKIWKTERSTSRSQNHWIRSRYINFHFHAMYARIDDHSYRIYRYLFEVYFFHFYPHFISFNRMKKEKNSHLQRRTIQISFMCAPFKRTTWYVMRWIKHSSDSFHAAKSAQYVFELEWILFTSQTDDKCYACMKQSSNCKTSQLPLCSLSYQILITIKWHVKSLTQFRVTIQYNTSAFKSIFIWYSIHYLVLYHRCGSIEEYRH